jgi:hypothetical protein
LSDFSVERRLIIFLTPAFAPWLNDDNGFLEKAVRRLYANYNGPSGSTFSAVVAVVDKLPTPQNIRDESPPEGKNPQGLRILPLADNGHEGLAYAAMPLRDADHAIRNDPDEEPSITMGPLGESQELGSYGDALRIPLANTVFQTGTPRTMTASLWQKNDRDDIFTLLKKEDIVNLHLKIGSSAPDERRSALAIPLLPLTWPRQVDACMGNIIRRVISSDGQSVTASEELEKVVPRYFESRGEPSQAVAVWALVIPTKGVDSISSATRSLLKSVKGNPDHIHENRWEELWRARPQHWSDQVSSALIKGARLHRVLSGGGGWGKKAGLLSLDPSAVADETSLSQSAEFAGFPDFNESSDDLSTALGQVIHEGEHIQFYISPKIRRKGRGNHLGDPKTLQLLSQKTFPWSFELGTIPSSVDTIEANSWQHKVSSLNQVIVFNNAFGALVEGGMTFKQRTELKAGESTAADGAVTKVDVPFSRFYAAISEHEEMTDEGVDEDVRNTEQ